MRSVSVWACTCGIRYKAICEGPDPEMRTLLACPKCQVSVEVIGAPLDLYEEIARGEWRVVDLGPGETNYLEESENTL